MEPEPLEIRSNLPSVPENPLLGELEILAQALERAGVDLTTLFGEPTMGQKITQEGPPP